MRQHRILISAIFISFFFALNFNKWSTTRINATNNKNVLTSSVSNVKCFIQIPISFVTCSLYFLRVKIQKHHRSRTLFWFDYVNLLCYFIQISSFKLVTSTYMFSIYGILIVYSRLKIVCLKMKTQQKY